MSSVIPAPCGKAKPRLAVQTHKQSNEMQDANDADSPVFLLMEYNTNGKEEGDGEG